MRKRNIFVLAIVLTLALMGAVYAAWSDTLVIDNSISTGDLDFAFSDGNVNCGGTGFDYFYDPTFGVSTALALDPKVLTVDVKNTYPGAYVIVTDSITNNSTIPAKLTLTSDFNPGEVTVTGITVNSVSVDLGDPSAVIDPGDNADIAYTLTVVDPDPSVVDNDNPPQNMDGAFFGRIFAEFNQATP